MHGMSAVADLGSAWFPHGSMDVRVALAGRRLRVYLKEIHKELTVLGDAELPLGDLRVSVAAGRAARLPVAWRRDPALVHMRVTYKHLPASG